MSNDERLEWAVAMARMGCDDARQLDWLERKLQWAKLMVDGGLLSMDEAERELRKL